MLLLIVLLSANAASAKPSRWKNQFYHSPNYFDFGICTGLGNYYGDIVPTFFSFQQLHPDVGLFARYNIGQYLALRSTFLYGTISGDDKYYNNAPRNLSFKSNIQELNATMEVNLLPYHAFKTKNKFAPYLFFGVGFFHFNPKAEFNGTWYALQPLGTEGEGISAAYGSKYPLMGLSIPIGGGLKYRVQTGDGSFITLGAEFGIRKTFTDYLDDVSKGHVGAGWYDSIKTYNGTLAADLAWREDEYYINQGRTEIVKGSYVPDIRRGNPNNKDWYYFGNITISYVFRHQTYHFSRH